jgi:hypothetical protein
LARRERLVQYAQSLRALPGVPHRFGE